MFAPWLILVTSLLLWDGIPGLEEPPDILEEQCCGRKLVGGVTYTLVRMNKVKTKTCKSSCIYTKENQPGHTYCFAKGPLAVKCLAPPNNSHTKPSTEPPARISTSTTTEPSTEPPARISSSTTTKPSTEPPAQISSSTTTKTTSTSPSSTTSTTSVGSQVTAGLVLAGGSDGNGDSLSSVETFPSLACTIPPLPQERSYLSLTLLPGDGGRLVACGGFGGDETVSSCVSWRRGQEAWTQYSTLREKRVWHSAAAVEGGKVMLLGGRDSPLTGEITGVQGTFSLQHSGFDSCAVVVKEGREVVVTGGSRSNAGSSHGFVDRYSSNGSFLGELPGMSQTRNGHGCAVYTNTSGTFYLVTGGYSGGRLSSTEILDPRTGSWQEAAPLPRSLSGLACGSPRAGSVVCACGYGGDYRDEVLRFHPSWNRWEQIGRLGFKRFWHGMVAGPLDFCEDPE